MRKLLSLCIGVCALGVAMSSFAVSQANRNASREASQAFAQHVDKIMDAGNSTCSHYMFSIAKHNMAAASYLEPYAFQDDIPYYTLHSVAFKNAVRNATSELNAAVRGASQAVNANCQPQTSAVYIKNVLEKTHAEYQSLMALLG